MKNPIHVFLVCLEHLLPMQAYKLLHALYRPIYPVPFEKYCVICGMRFTHDWWTE